jgi:hypothetical protein
VFAIEELSRKLESRSSGLIITAIVLAGLMGVSAFGNRSYFGVIQVTRLGWDALLPGLMVDAHLRPAGRAVCQTDGRVAHGIARAHEPCCAHVFRCALPQAAGWPLR